MAVIFNKTFSEGSRPYLTLAGEEYVRPLNIGTTWTRIRVLMLVAVRSAASGNNNLTGCQFITGLCSGTDRPYGGVTTQHFLGFLQGADSNLALSQALTYTANSGNPYYNAATGGYMTQFTRIGSSLGFQNYFGGSVAYVVADQGPARKGLIGFEVIKAAGVPNWSMRAIVPGSKPNSAAVNFTTTDLLTVLEDDSTSMTIQGQSLSWGSLNGSISVDEATNGSLNCLDISWNKTQNPAEIYGIGVSRFA